MKKLLILIAMLALPTFAQNDNNQKADYERHYKQATDEFLMAAGFLAGGMVMVPVEDYLCKKMGASPFTTGTVKVVSGILFGSASLYFAGLGAHDAGWIGYKISREF